MTSEDEACAIAWLAVKLTLKIMWHSYVFVAVAVGTYHIGEWVLTRLSP